MYVNVVNHLDVRKLKKNFSVKIFEKFNNEIFMYDRRLYALYNKKLALFTWTTGAYFPPWVFYFKKLWNRTRNSTNQIVHFFNLKMYNRNFSFAFGCKIPLARFASVLHMQIVWFFANCLRWCLVFLKIYVFLLACVFVLC